MSDARWSGLDNSGLRRLSTRAGLVDVICPEASQHGRLLAVVSLDGGITHESSYFPDGNEPEDVRHIPCTCGANTDSTHPLRFSRLREVETEARRAGKRIRVNVADVR